MKHKLLKLLKIKLLSSLALIVLVFAILYFSMNEQLPEGESGTAADAFALKIQDAVNHDAYLQTDYLQWTFRNKNHYLWNRKSNTTEVKWKDIKVNLIIDNPSQSTVYQNEIELIGPEKQKLIKKALASFNNDSFWVVAPHKLFDPGVTRQLIHLEDNSKGLLVTYSSGGTTPGDSYLWKVDQNYRPVSYQMWVSIIPIGGVEASWENWTITESGANLAQQHSLLGFGIPIGGLRGWSDLEKQ